ncbi:MAG: M55 family metallopeptidase [Atribacterota bacterium]|nr:M55 family metallopeptidase [Atribacterota bacterium]
MKIYISADIEGITGITHWDETEKSKSDYQQFAKQMTYEVRAACEGAIKAGAKEIWIKDAHDTGRNILADELPQMIKLVRGWSEHPYLMVQEMDKSFDALLMIGYHSFGSSSSNPLSHTLSSSALNYIKLNGEYASEFLIHSYAAATVGVPVVFVSGDEGICNEANKLNKNIKTLAVNKGIGNSVISIHPKLAVEKIKESVGSISKEDIDRCKIKLPEHFKVKLSFRNHTKAFKASFYPGMEQISSTNLVFETDDYFEVLRMLLFAV